MRKVEFFDTSLRDGEQTPGVNFSIKEKVAIAKQLEKWGISVIEAGFPAASPDSFEAVKQFNYLGYQYCEALSNVETYVFIRKKGT